MPLPLIPIFCTSKVSIQTLSQLLKEAYAEGPDSPDNLLLVHDKQTIPSAQDNNQQATLPPISTAPSSDFYGATIASLVTYLQDNATDGYVSSSYFLVVDKQTAEDMTVLVVKCPWEATEGDNEGGLGIEAQSVRVSSSQANAPVVAMEVGCGGIEEMICNADDDGVYRGGRGPAPQEGGPAPRKMLG